MRLQYRVSISALDVITTTDLLVKASNIKAILVKRQPVKAVLVIALPESGRISMNKEPWNNSHIFSMAWALNRGLTFQRGGGCGC